MKTKFFIVAGLALSMLAACGSENKNSSADSTGSDTSITDTSMSNSMQDSAGIDSTNTKGMPDSTGSMPVSQP